MKIIFLSNAPWAGTGYSQQTAIWARKFRDEGHDVAICAFYGLDGNVVQWEGIPVYPGGAHAYGMDVLTDRAGRFFGQPDDGLVITLVDAWVLDPAVLSKLNVACWTPVDHEPVPPGVTRVLEAAQVSVVAMSRHGQAQLEQAGFAPMYAPHAIDTSVFAPQDKQALRRELSLPESAFIVGMVAANKGQPPRKGFPEAIAAFAQFAQTHDDAFLLLHTEPYGVLDGVNLPALLSHYGVDPGRVSLSGAPDYTIALPQEVVARIVGSMDVLLNPSYGEGFGIPVLEAQSCGVPVVVTDFTAMAEVGAVGFRVGGQLAWSRQAAFQKVPDIAEIVWALDELHDTAGDLREAARAHALRYDIQTVWEEHWHPTLAQLEALTAEPQAVAA